MSPRLLQRGLLGSLLLHVAVLAGFVWSSSPVVPLAAEPSRVISFGFVAARAGTQQPSVAAAQPQPRRPETTSAPVIAAARNSPSRVKAKPNVKPQPVIRRERAEPTASVKPRPQPTARPAVASQAGDQGAQGSRRSEQKLRETGMQQQSVAAAPDSSAYDLLVRRHLLARKQTPRLLGRQRSGSVIVEFVIDRQGRLVRQLMGKTSGIREFDHAARTLVSNAAPYPSAPADHPWQERRYRIEIQYQSR